MLKPDLKTAEAVPCRVRAFTLIELLVVIAIIAILAAVLLPVLNAAKIRGQTATCINNQKEFATAWLMYSTDNNDFTAGNHWQDEQAWLTHSNENWVSGWEGADGSGGNGTSGGQGGPDNTNQYILVNSAYSTLGQYTRNPNLYLCPAYHVVAPVSSAGGQRYLMARSYSMNCWIGYNTDAPGSQTIANSPLFNYSACVDKVYTKTTAITAGLGPSDLFVFMEERAESIDDGWFETVPSSPGTIYNWPTDFHNGSCTLGFADGHVETHRWFNTATIGGAFAGMCFTAPQQVIVQAKWGQATVSGKQQSDLNWENQHATCAVP